MKKITPLFLLLASMLYAQVPTQNWAGHWNIVSNNDASVRFSNVVVSGTGANVNQIYGRARFGCCTANYIYFWSSKAARDAGDTAAVTVVASIRSFPEGVGVRTLSLTTRNTSGYVISMQFVGSSPALSLDAADFDIGLMNVTVPYVTSAVASGISAQTVGKFDTTYFSHSNTDVYAVRTGSNAGKFVGNYTIPGTLSAGTAVVGSLLPAEIIFPSTNVAVLGTDGIGTVVSKTTRGSGSYPLLVNGVAGTSDTVAETDYLRSQATLRGLGAAGDSTAFLKTLTLKDQGPGYLIQAGAGLPVTNLSCTETQIAAFNGGGSASWFGVISGPSLFALGGTGAYLSVTATGATFANPSRGTVSSIRQGTYGLGKYAFLATTAADSTNGILTSPDAVTWTAVKSVHASTAYNAGACSGSLCVVVGQQSSVATTTNWTTFTRQSGFGGSLSIRGVAWSPDNAEFAAVTDAAVIKTSPDGVTWTTRTTPGGITNLWSITWDDLNNQYVAVGNSGVIITSPTGATWTQQTSGTTKGLYAVNYASGRVIAVGDSISIYTSTNVTSWTNASIGGSSADLNAVGFVGSTFMAAGENGRIYTSTNGTTWARVGVVQPACLTPPYLTNDSSVARTNTTNSFTLLNTFATALRETSLLSVPALATNSSGDHIAATTTGTGSTLALSANPNFTGLITGDSLNLSTLTGTGTRIITATSTGRAGNSTAIDGAYTWSGAQVFSSSVRTVGLAAFGTATTTFVNPNSGAIIEAERAGAIQMTLVSNGSAVQYTGYSQAGTKGVPLATAADAQLVALGGRGYTTAFVSNTPGMIAVNADSTWSATNTGAYIAITGTPRGSTTPAEWARFRNSNFLLGVTAAGTGALKTIALTNTATAPSTTVDLVHLYGKDLSAGNAAFSVTQEAPVSAAAAVVSTNKWPVSINGTTYYILMTTVP